MRFRSLLCALALFALPLLPSVARADTFTLNSVLTQGTLTGTVTINPQAGTVTDSNLLFTLGSYQTTVNGDASVRRTTTPYPFTFTSILDQNAAGELLTLDLPVTSLLGYTGGAVCGGSTGMCFFSSSPPSVVVSTFRANINGSPVIANFVSGSLTPTAVAATPEPGTLGLLGTGVLVVAGGVRRRSLLPGSSKL